MAVARDAGGEHAKPDITLRVDGRDKDLFYDPTTGRLSRATKKLCHGSHTVKITVTDGADKVAVRA